MEENLKNTCHVDRRVMRKAYVQALRSSTLAMLVICLLMLGVWVFYLVVVPAEERKPVLTLLLPLLILFDGVLTLTAPARNAQIVMKRLQESRQVKEYESTLVFSPEELLASFDFSQDQLRLPYKEIRRVLVTKNLLLLKTKAKQFYLLDPARFENGAEADFWKLMSEKCPKAVPKALRA